MHQRKEGSTKHAPGSPKKPEPIYTPGIHPIPIEPIKDPDWKDYDYLQNSASTTDMTGLIYRAAANEAEARSYEEVYEYLPPEINEK